MPKYPETAVTSKLGVNYVKTIIETAGSIFHKIDQENDLGIDAIIELVKDGSPLNKQFAVQIKSGQSYYNGQSNQCLIPVEKHFQYWRDYPLPVYGLVYIPALGTGNWVNIKNYLNRVGQCSTIKFDRTKINIFDAENFTKVFLPGILKNLPDFSVEEAKNLFGSYNAAESYLGLIILFHSAPNAKDTWDLFIEYFKQREQSEIPPVLIYYLAHIPWHPDIYYHGEQITKETEDHARKRLNEFNKQDVLKLLNFVNEEVGISRGSIGQSVEAIISSLSNRNKILSEIMEDFQVQMHFREVAALIYAYNNKKSVLPFLYKLSEQGSWYASELQSYIKEYGGVDPYA